jgi:hypothetical protein
MHSAIQDLQLEHLWVVHPGGQEYSLHDRISVIPMDGVVDLVEDLRKSKKKK